MHGIKSEKNVLEASNGERSMGGQSGPLKNGRFLIQGGFYKRSNPKGNEVGNFKELCFNCNETRHHWRECCKPKHKRLEPRKLKSTNEVKIQGWANVANFGNDKDMFLSSWRQAKGLTRNQTKHKLKLRSWPSRVRFHPYKGKNIWDSNGCIMKIPIWYPFLQWKLHRYVKKYFCKVQEEKEGFFFLSLSFLTFEKFKWKSNPTTFNYLVNGCHLSLQILNH